jgi:hypothetical protein
MMQPTTDWAAHCPKFGYNPAEQTLQALALATWVTQFGTFWTLHAPQLM